MIDVIELLGDDEIEAHTSIILTYELDLTLYDGLVCRALSGAGIVNQLIFCDLRMHVPALEAIANLRRIGRRYSVTPVPLGGAFHPKIYLTLGRRRGRLIVGSGNATTGGLLRNAELFGTFEYDADTDQGPHPAFESCISLIRGLIGDAAEPVRRQLQRAVAWTPWLSLRAVGDGREVLLSGPGRPPLLDELRQRLAKEVVEEAIVCSSSFDRRLDGLSAIASLTNSRRVECIVSPDRLDLDGAVVRRKRGEITWRPFVDPQSTEQLRRDARLHAKLFVFRCQDGEIGAFGSANASRPALISSENVEALVVLPKMTSPPFVERLGLAASLETAPVNDKLEENTWPAEPRDELDTYQVVVSAATVREDGIALSIVRGDTREDTSVALSRSLDRPLVVAPVTQSESTAIALLAVPENVMVAWLVGPSGERRSNPVSLTWPAVAERAMSLGLGAKVEGALAALADGLVVGTVLFELLSQVPDFEVALGAPAGATEPSAGVPENDGGPTGSGEAFYTDALPQRHTAGEPFGDRSDLELLARLIQPLRSAASSSRASQRGDDEDEHDEVMDEEAQRRALDAAREDRRAVGPRRPTVREVERARARLGRRLARAASSLERALALRQRYMPRTKATGERRFTLAPASIARQLWMLRIAAALTGREMTTEEGEIVIALDPIDFADYVLRVSRTMAGGKDGGLLALLPEQAWAGHDGHILREGLRFLWTCTIWAAAVVVDFWNDDDNAWYAANDLHDAVPELVAARFVRAIDRYCDEPDLKDLVRRFPAWNDPGAGWFAPWEERLCSLAKLIDSIEGAPGEMPARPGTSPTEPGSLVFHPVIGLTILVAAEGHRYRLLDLSGAVVGKDDRRIRTFDGRVCAAQFEHAMGPLSWRQPGWLEND